MTHSFPAGSAAYFHAVRFYESADALGRIAAGFLADGLAQGATALAIATAAHSHAIETSLADRGYDLAQLQRDRTLTILDADVALNAFMRDGVPDATLFHRTFGHAIDAITASRPSSIVRAYGEMVDILWRSGRREAAVQVERLWNELVPARNLALLCGYAMSSFYDDGAVKDICAQHSHVIFAGGEAGRLA